GRLGEGLLPLARGVDCVRHAADNREDGGAGDDGDHRVAADLEPHVGQLVAAAVQLGQAAIEARAHLGDLGLDLARHLAWLAVRFAWLAVRFARLAVHSPGAHAIRSFAHRTSSLSVRRVVSSGSLTRLPQPTIPAMPPTISTAAATSNAATHAGMTSPSASAAATRISDTAQMAHNPATPSPLAIPISAFKSALSSALASSTSFFASVTASRVMCCRSSLFESDSTRAGTDTGGGNAIRSAFAAGRFDSAISSSC